MIVATAMLCLALNVYHEARGEPVLGRYAVAKVTMNRADHDPDRVCKEVFRRKQFSWANKGVTKTEQGWKIAQHLTPKDKTAWDHAKRIAKMTLAGRMPGFMGEAKFYHADYVRPNWASEMQKVARIGRHIFYVQST